MWSSGCIAQVTCSGVNPRQTDFMGSEGDGACSTHLIQTDSMSPICVVIQHFQQNDHISVIKHHDV